MRHLTLPFVMTVFGAAFAIPYAAIADEPLAPYEGRPLPPVVKQMVWQKACDVPTAEAEGDVCAGGMCRFKRSSGDAFKPQLAAWMDLPMFQYAAGQNAMLPALIDGKLATADELGGDARMAVAIASGLAVDLQPDDGLMQLNPLLVRWVTRELLPPANTPMCGKTAKEFYQASFSRPTRMMVDVYVQLKARGGLRAVKLPELDKSFTDHKGRYAAMCDAIAAKTKVEDESYPRATTCWWWLRRAASGGTDEFALLFGRALKNYDGDVYKQYAGSLPAELSEP